MLFRSLSSSLATIGSYAFNGCAGLTNLTLSSSLTALGNYAFNGCASLIQVFFRGNAPSLGGTYVFRNANNATLYYFPGTTGWSTPFGGRPAKLWNAAIQTGDPSFGVGANGFGFNIAGTTNLPILLEAATNLVRASWATLKTCSITNGSIYFSDAAWTNYRARYYRLRTP